MSYRGLNENILIENEANRDLCIKTIQSYCCNLDFSTIYMIFLRNKRMIYMTCNTVNPNRASNDTKLQLLCSLGTLGRTT